MIGIYWKTYYEGLDNFTMKIRNERRGQEKKKEEFDADGNQLILYRF